MKKYLISLLFLLVFAFPAKAQSPWDLIYHAIPVSPSFDITEEISQISGQVQTAIGQGKKIIMTLKTDASSLQSAVTSTFNKIKSGAILGILANPGQADVGFCGQDVNKTKAKKIAKKVKEVLLIAKSDDFSYLTEHQKKREEFYMDNLYAIYAASLITQQEVENDIKAKIDKAKSCAEGKGGECGIPSTDEGGNNETIFTYGKTLEAMDSVVRLWESIAALKARLAAVKMIYSITPALDAKATKKNKGKQAFLNIPQAIAKSHSSTPLAFAQTTLGLKKDAKEYRAVTKADMAKESVAKTEEKTANKVNLSNVKTGNLRTKFVEPKVVKPEIKAVSNKPVELQAESKATLAKDVLAKTVAGKELKAVSKNAISEKVDLQAKTVAKEKIADADIKNALAKDVLAKTVAGKELKAEAELKSDAKLQASDGVTANNVEMQAVSTVKNKLDADKVMKSLDVKAAAENLNKTTIDQVQAASMIKKENEVMQYVVNTIEFVSPDMNEDENALASVQDEINATNEMTEEVEGKVSLAVEAHNFVAELPKHKETAEQYIEAQQRYKRAFDMLVDSEECAIRYLNGFYTKPHLVWSGNLPLKNANKHELRKGISGWAFNAFELLKSGEVTDSIKAFEEAKKKIDSEDENGEAEEENKDYLTDEKALKEKIDNTMAANNAKPDEVAQETLSDAETSEMGDDTCELLDVDTDDPDYIDCKEREKEKGKKKKKRFSEAGAGKTEDEAISSDKKEGAGSEARKSAMFAWQIGSEASKLLAEEDWGSPSRDRKMIWNDTKRFYRKYLEKKYDNVSRYMKSFSEADLYEIIADKLVGAERRIADAEYQKKRIKELQEQSDKLKESLEKKIADKNAKREAYLAKMNEAAEEKKKIEAEMNDLNSELLSLKKEINATKDAAAKEVMESMQDKLTAPLEFPKKGEKPQDTMVGLVERTKMASQANDETSKEMDKKKEIKEKEERVKEIKARIAELAIEKMQKQLAIQKAKRKGQTGLLSAEELAGAPSLEEQLLKSLYESEENGGILAKVQNEAKDRTLNSIRQVLEDSNKANPIENFDITAAMKGITDGARNLIIQAQMEANRIIITNGLSKMYEMGDRLYMGNYYPEVQKIHDDMINELRAVKFTYDVGTKMLSPLLSLRDLAVFAEFLEDVDTSPEKEGFFVGSTPKKRDLQAPYSLAYDDYDLPPVREVFHFDAVDFGNVQAPPNQDEDTGESADPDWLESIIKKLEDAKFGKQRRVINKEDFLNFGGDIPKIWIKMLEDYPFVESRLPLSEVLQGETDDCEVATFVRGGVMPCLYGDGKYFMDVDMKGNYVDGIAEAKHKNLPPCSSIILKGNNTKPYHTFWKTYLLERNGENKTDINCEYSELGMLFEADEDNNLYIKKIPFKNFNRINRRDGDPIDKMIPAARRNLAAARHSELSRNQIGDFLRQSENEKAMQESLEAAKKAYEQSKESLYAMFKENGFVPSETFMLTNKDDYKTAEKVLKALKKQRINKAVAALTVVEAKEEARLKKEKEEYKKEKDRLEAEEKAEKARLKAEAKAETAKLKAENKSVKEIIASVSKRVKVEKKSKQLKKPEENKALKEKSRKMNRLINFMNTDVESVLKISMSDGDSKDLAIRLAKAIINDKILGLFKKKNKEESDELGEVEEAYCAIY